MKTLFVTLFLTLCEYSSSFGQEAKDFVDPFSTLSCYVMIQKDNKPLRNATGFFVVINKKMYFITNNHVAGAEFFQSEYLRNHKHNVPPDSLPNNLKVRLYDHRLGSSFFITLPFTNKQDTVYVKFWENEKNKTGLMDVIAFPIEDAKAILLKNTGYLGENLLSEHVDLYTGEDLFIIGFPLDLGRTNVYSIWKRGTIASEPNLLSIDNSNFLIDATTRGGMSGSPVVFRGNNFNSNGSYNINSGITTFLIGIYSAQNYPMEIGVVYRLEKIIAKLKQIN